MVDNLTVQQVAVYLCIHENTVYRWLEEGTVFPNAFRIRKGWRIPKDDVDRAKKRGGGVEQESAIVRQKTMNKPSAGFVNRWKQ